MYSLLRPLLFRLDPESSHDLVMAMLSKVSASTTLANSTQSLLGNRVPHLPSQVMGLNFKNPVGLAAGLDKQGNCANALASLGFGWVELGTVTPLPQPGNARPRMFRLTSHDAIINRMGFNSIGLQSFLENIKNTSPSIIKGINIGKNAATDLENANNDYLICLDAVYSYADYIAINISSPNTKNLRDLQQDDALDSLLSAINHKHQQLIDQNGHRVPLILKIAPDLEPEQINTIANLLRKYKIDGVAATNTTISRDRVNNHHLAGETGGLSGGPVRASATEVIHKLYQNLQGEIPIIGIGGIDSPNAAIDKLKAGADLIQLYTGFIYQGPKLIREIVNGLKSCVGEQSFNDFVKVLHTDAS